MFRKWEMLGNIWKWELLGKYGNLNCTVRKIWKWTGNKKCWENLEMETVKNENVKEMWREA